MSLKQKIRQYREKPLNQKYRKRRDDLRSYDRWLEGVNGTSDRPKREALSRDLVLLTQGEGELSLTAAARINAYMAEHPETLLLYGDEDENIFGKEYGNPWLKPDWSPDTFLDHDYLGSVLVARREFYEWAAGRTEAPEASAQQNAGESAPESSVQQTTGESTPEGSGQQAAGEGTPEASAQQNAGESVSEASVQQTIGTGVPEGSVQQMAGEGTPESSVQQTVGEGAPEGSEQQTVGEGAPETSVQQTVGEGAPESSAQQAVGEGTPESSVRQSAAETGKEPSRLELLTLAGGFTPGCHTIAHLPYILFHRKNDWHTLAREHSLLRIPDLSAHLVSIIIPSKDHYDILCRCLDSLAPTIREIPYEILVVDNGSTPETKEKIKLKLSALAGDSEEVPENTSSWTWAALRKNAAVAAQPPANLRGVYYLYDQKPFNFSNMCNTGAANAQGDLLLFLNDDTQAIEAGWLETMAVKALSDWAGAVGAKLLYPGDDLIQHAGITNIRVGPVHKLQYLPDDDEYYDDRNHGIRNMLAVTGACLLMRADRFHEAGGFEESLRVAFNDVDLCYTLYEHGYHNICCNDIALWHHESLSRGREESQEDQHRLMNERNLLSARHPSLEGKDPYYNPGLNWKLLDTSIRPSHEEGVEIEDIRRPKAFNIPSGAREDPCLKCTFELVTAGQMQGWIAVLGSNNACFESAVLLQSAAEPAKTYRIDFTKQYRIDLERNMPDQENVALCGFAFKLEQELPAGEYRLGAYSKDKLSRLKLVSWKAATVIV